MTDRASQVIQQVVDELSQSNGVAALVLAGSRVKGNQFASDKFSDIEMYIVAFDEKHEEVQSQLLSIQSIFGEDVVFAYRNQWAGWSLLFKDLLRLELPLVKASDDSVFTRSEEQKIEVLYSKPNFEIKRTQKKESDKKESPQIIIEQSIKDFWYMAVYASQHIARGEIWLSRDAIRISMQGKVKRLLQEIYHKDTLTLDPNRKIELTWGQKELGILKETSSTYSKEDVTRSFWANINYMEQLLDEVGVDKSLFSEYKKSLLPEIESILG